MKPATLTVAGLILAMVWVSGATPQTETNSSPMGGLSVVRAVTPQIPERILRCEHIDRVIVELLVTVEGDVAEPRVICTTHKELKPYVLEAVKQWKFTPKLVDGKPVAARVHIPIDFCPKRLADGVEMTVVAKN